MAAGKGKPSTINELKLELTPFSNTPHTSHQTPIPRTGSSPTSSSLDFPTRLAKSLTGAAVPGNTELLAMAARGQAVADHPWPGLDLA